MQVPHYLGSLQRVDIMCAYTHLERPHPTVGEDEDRLFEEEETSKIKMPRSRFPFTSLVSLYRNDTSLLSALPSNSIVNFVSRRSKTPQYCLTGITVADPGTGEEWAALMPVDVDATFTTAVKDFLIGKKGVYLPHAELRSFVLQPIRKISRLNFFLNFSCYTVMGKLSHWIRLFYSHHFMFDHSHEFFFNLTLIEKRLVAFTGIFFAILIESFYQGFSNNAFYFLARLDSKANVVRYILAEVPQHTHLVAAFASCLLMFVLLLSLRILSGKWIRNVQDKTSYWQGVQLIRTCFFFIKCALRESCHFCSQRLFCSVEEIEDYKSVSEHSYADLSIASAYDDGDKPEQVSAVQSVMLFSRFAQTGAKFRKPVVKNC